MVDASLGVHPLHVKTAADLASVEHLESLINQHDKVVAIGESGLDYYYDESTKELQQLSFINHLQAGAKTKFTCHCAHARCQARYP